MEQIITRDSLETHRQMDKVVSERSIGTPPIIPRRWFVAIGALSSQRE